MTLRELYNDIGGDYEQVIGRLGGARGEKLLHKLICMLPKDSNMELLSCAIKEKDYESAFRAAHTYKGIVLNLGISPLVEIVKELTEQLRGERNEDQIMSLFQELECWNKKVLQDITKLTE